MINVKPTVVVDLDGVIASWPRGSFYRPGPPVPGVEEFLKELAGFARVVIYTCRTNSELYDRAPVHELLAPIWQWLKTNRLDRYVAAVHIGQGKPFAACYIDDKAIHCEPESGLPESNFQATLHHARAMCQNGKEHPNRDAT
jgi:hypothetical protein